MGIVWSMSAAVATLAVALVFGAIINKAKARPDSPLNKMMEKVKSFNNKGDNNFQDEHYYKRLSNRGTIKY